MKWVPGRVISCTMPVEAFRAVTATLAPAVTGRTFGFSLSQKAV
ncbi:MAG TPA: hypothetical protein VGB81_13945 [Devosia sp.]